MIQLHIWSRSRKKEQKKTPAASLNKHSNKNDCFQHKPLTHRPPPPLCLSEHSFTLGPCGPPHCKHSERNCPPCIIKQFELTWAEFNYVTHDALLLGAFKSNIVSYMLGGSVFRYIIQVSQLHLHSG